MMGIISIIRKIFGKNAKNVEIGEENDENKTYDNSVETEQEIHSLWDFLTFNQNTQAAHLASVIQFDEWVTMDEIRRRIRDLFQIDYKNARSLYPYLKTMVDMGLMETNNIGGKRKWRKKDLLIKIEKKKKKEEEEEETVAITAE